jgi:hypothetical protein
MFTSGKSEIQLLRAGFPLHSLRKSGFFAVLDPPDAPTPGAYFVTVFNHSISVRETVQLLHNADTGATYSRYWSASGWSAWLTLAQVAGSGNLTLGDVTATSVEILIDTGTDVEIPSATNTDAGVMSAADKAKLDAIEPGAEQNPSAADIVAALDVELNGTSWRDGANLSVTRDATTVTVESDLGDDAVLPAATDTLAGVMTAADKAKLDGIEPAATADMTPVEIVAAVNAALGSTGWQNGTPGSAQTNPSVRVATSGNIDIANDLNPGDTLDGITLSNNDLVLVKDQTNAEENGIYVVGVTPVRHASFSTYDSYVGAIVTVQEGTANEDTVWFCTSDVGGTIDVDPLVFVETEITPTNLSMSRDATQVVINSSTGSGAVLPAATDTDAGVMTAADKAKLDGLNSAGNTSLTVTHNAGDVDVTPSGAGTGDTIDAVSDTLAGVMTPAMKIKLDGIEENAEQNLSPAEIVSAINGELGGTGWQTVPGSLAEAKAFLARRTSSLTVGSGSPVTVTFPTEVYDAGDVHDTGTGEYQPGVNGIVFLSVSASGTRADASSSWGDIQIVKNGSTVLATSRDINAGTNNVSLAIIDTCLATDYYTVRSIGASGDGGSINFATFSGCMINTGTVEVEGNTNLTFTRDATTVTVESDTGTDAVLPAATDTLAGVMTAADKDKLDSIEADANNYVHPNHNGDVQSIGDGTTTISPNAVNNTKLADMANGTIKGRYQVGTGDPEDLTASQVREILNVEDGATADMSGSEIVSAIDTELGGTGWRTGGGGGGSDQAIDINYDNVLSGLAATNVQEALDELAAATTGGATHLSAALAEDSVTVESDTGTDAIIPAASTTEAGVMSAADKTKLDSIEAGATDDLTAEEIEDLLDTFYGNDDWREPQRTPAEIISAINGELGSTAWQNTSPGTSQTNPSVRAATTANITIATALNDGDTLDGVLLAENDLVLVKNQSNPAENGIYVVGTTPARHDSFNTYDSYVGIIVTVQEGTANEDTVWLCTSDAGGTLDTDPLLFVETEITPTNLSATRNATQVTVNSSTGTAAILAAADASNAGVMTAAMFSKLDGIETGATADMTGAEIVSAINGELGGTGWQSGGTGGGSGGIAASFLGLRTTTQNMSTSFTTVSFTENHDVDGTFNGTTWTPGVTGLAVILASVSGQRTDGNGSFGEARIVKNGSQVFLTQDGGTSVPAQPVITLVVPVTPSDSFVLQSRMISGSGRVNSASFSGFVITGLGGDSGGASAAEDVAYDNAASGLTADDVQAAIDELAAELAGVSGETNLSFTRDGTTVTVQSDTGTDAILPAASTTDAGVMSAADKTKLDGIEAGATADMSASEIVSAVTSNLGQSLWRGEGDRAINTQTGTTYTLAVSDAGKLVTLDNASPITLTIPANASVAIPVQKQIDIAQIGDGQVTVSPAGGVTIISLNGNLKLAGKGAGAMLLKLATNTWLLMGAIVS